MVGIARHGRRHIAFIGEDPDMNKFGTVVTISVAASGTAFVPAGVYLVGTSTNTIQFYNGTAWIGAGTAGYVVSDGTLVRLNNATTAAVVSSLLPLTSD